MPVAAIAGLSLGFLFGMGKLVIEAIHGSQPFAERLVPRVLRGL